MESPKAWERSHLITKHSNPRIGTPPPGVELDSMNAGLGPLRLAQRKSSTVEAGLGLLVLCGSVAILFATGMQLVGNDRIFWIFGALGPLLILDSIQKYYRATRALGAQFLAEGIRIAGKLEPWDRIAHLRTSSHVAYTHGLQASEDRYLRIDFKDGRRFTIHLKLFGKMSEAAKEAFTCITAGIAARIHERQWAEVMAARNGAAPVSFGRTVEIGREGVRVRGLSGFPRLIRWEAIKGPALHMRSFGLMRQACLAVLYDSNGNEKKAVLGRLNGLPDVRLLWECLETRLDATSKENRTPFPEGLVGTLGHVVT